jgi:glycosyltransferase involved in cell wall biosynthesis
MCSRIPDTLEDAYGVTLALVPAYNAGRTVADVVRRLTDVSPHLSVLVVSDGSTDDTAEVAARAGATVIRHEHNMGKGAALRTGFDHLLSTERQAVITLDADGQHSPEEIPKLVEAWNTTGADIVIGTRKWDVGNMPRLRIFTNAVSSWLVSLSAGTRIPDSQSGYRLLDRDVIENIPTTSAGYGAESEILIKAARRGYKIGSAPISTIYRGEKSYIHPLKQPLLFLGLILRSFFWRFEHIDRKQSERHSHSTYQ